jgi:sterol desaturase/sphingolipid hydroxylase (fatty acid hydroxylase superfamily)
MNVFLTCMLAAIAIAERSPALRFGRQPFLRRGFATDLFYLATGAVALGLGIRHAAARLAEASAGIGPASGALAASLVVVLAIVLYDLGAYLCHLLLHRFGALWRLHEVHHSSPTLDWLATFRAHVGEHALRHLASPALLLLTGFPPATVAFASAIYTAWAAFTHANIGLDLRFLEPLFITPRLHRLHHVPATSGGNLGTIFSLWDRLRATLVADPAAPLLPLGVPGREASYPQTWLAQLVEPFRARRTPLSVRRPDPASGFAGAADASAGGAGSC